MYQKQEIIIDKGSSEAMQFYTDVVLPYFEKLRTDKIVEHCVDKESGEEYTREYKVHAEVSTWDETDRITVVSEEDWKEIYDHKNHFYNCIVPFDDSEELKPKDGKLGYIVTRMSEEIKSIDGDMNSFDIDCLIKAYREKAESLGDSCRISVVGGGTEPSSVVTRAYCYSSMMGNEVAESLNNSIGHYYGGPVYLNKGRSVAISELPETRWFGLSPILTFVWFNGKQTVDDPDAKFGYREESISEELYAKYREATKYTDELLEKITFDIPHMEAFDEFSDLVIKSFDKTKAIGELSTNSLKQSIAALEDLVLRLDADNNELIELLEEEEGERLHIHLIFYSKDFKLFDVAYDEDEKKMRYTLFEL